MKQPQQQTHHFAKLAEIASKGKPEEQAPQTTASVAIPSIDSNPSATAAAIAKAYAKSQGGKPDEPTDATAAAIIAADKKRTGA